MTWAEFVALAKSAGVKDDDKIDYIDVDSYPDENDFHRHISKKDGVETVHWTIWS